MIDGLVRRIRAGTVWVNTYNIYDAGAQGFAGAVVLPGAWVWVTLRKHRQPSLYGMCRTCFKHTACTGSHSS